MAQQWIARVQFWVGERVRCARDVVAFLRKRDGRQQGSEQRESGLHREQLGDDGGQRQEGADLHEFRGCCKVADGCGARAVWRFNKRASCLRPQTFPAREPPVDLYKYSVRIFAKLCSVEYANMIRKPRTPRGKRGRTTC